MQAKGLEPTIKIGKDNLQYYVLYDVNDNVICYFDTLLEFSVKFGYPIKELNRKYRKSINFINLHINNNSYRLYVFE